MSALLLTMACTSSDDIASPDDIPHVEPGDTTSRIVPVDVSLQVSAERQDGTTRMSALVTQNNHQFRAIEQFLMIPFDETNQPSSCVKVPTTSFTPYDRTDHNHYYNESMDLQTGTKSFVCYAKAKPETGGSFVNGVTNATIPETNLTLDGISFTPEVIYDSTELPEAATGIAGYLTRIAQSIKGTALFNPFINEGRLVAASSMNAEKMRAWVEAQGGTLPAELPTLPTGYPASSNLPDGAAVVQWSDKDNKFEAKSTTSVLANLNTLNRFVYPAELYYYANSPIKTSANSKKDESKDEYNQQTWEQVLSKYETDNGVVTHGVRSVALKNALSYAVGSLRIGLVANSTLTDALGNSIALTAESFPLTGVMVSGQHPQAYDFTPNDATDGYISYDNQFSGISLGAANTATPTTFAHTLVLQSKDGEGVRFAMEFTNNSGQEIHTLNGIVYQGTKFYLVGTIEVPNGQTIDYRKRVFTKNYYTQGTVTISSLRQAYPYLPDLLDARLETDIRLVPDWILSTPTNVPL